MMERKHFGFLDPWTEADRVCVQKLKTVPALHKGARMKRKASKPAPYQIPTKLTKKSLSSTVSRKMSTLKRAGTSVRPPLPPPKWPSIRHKAPSLKHASSLPKPDWPALVPPSKARKESDRSASSSADITEISEEPPTRAPGLRRMSTLPLEEEKSRESSKTLSKTGSKTMSRTGSKTLSKQGSSLSGVAAVATLEKKESVVTLDTSGTVTTVTRLASGSSVGETTGLSHAPPSIRKELSKAASLAGRSTSLTKKVSSIRVWGTDAPEEPPSLSRSSSKSSKVGSLRKEPSIGPSTSAPSVPLPPGGLIEIVFSFDTTGSMSSCIDEVRGRVGDMMQRLQADIPGIRIGVIAHGDYCDAENFYVIKWIDFGASLPELTDFVQTISGTGGGDFEECYELAMARAQTELSWTPGSQRSLVMIGDAIPHDLSFYNNRDEKLNWEEEARKLAAMDVKIYAVQALNNSRSTSFYQALARLTGGRHLKLDQFNNIFDMLMVLCYNERGSAFVQAYEDEVRTREGPAGLQRDLERLFSTIRGGKPGEAAKGAKGKTKAAPAAKGKGKAAATKGKGKATAVKGKGKGTKTKAASKASAKAAATNAKGKGVKSVKGRKPTKAAGKKKTKTTKTKSKKLVPGVTRKFREAVKDEDFGKGSCLKKVKWTDWFKAIIPSLPKPKGKLAWNFKPRSLNRRTAHRTGLRNLNILKDRNNAPAIYEFAVQLKAKKRYVVYFKTCSIWRLYLKWDTNLLNDYHLHPEVNAVLKAGGQIWMRRGNVESDQQLTEVRGHVNKLYDYAWKTRKCTHKQPAGVRHVKKCNMLISGNRES
ncbi:hypothetical protein ACOMHN_058275 [Nucella lapillus]